MFWFVSLGKTIDTTNYIYCYDEQWQSAADKAFPA